MTTITIPIPTFARARSTAKRNLALTGATGAGWNGIGVVVGYPMSIAADVGSARAA